MKVVSLFSGAGGLDLGFEWAGHKIVWANDIFDDAVRTYRLNFKNPIDSRPIQDVPMQEIPFADIVIGGFPCQGFSVANWKRTVEDTRNQLYQNMIRVISHIKPKYFIGENVKGLVSIGKGAVLEKVLSDFELAEPGYRIRYAVLNAADYGVPQHRKRLIILGERRDITNKIEFPPPQTHFDPNELAFSNSQKQSWISVGQALKDLPDPDKPNNLNHHTYSRYKLRFNGYIGHRHIDPNLPAPTVTARGDDKGGVVVIHHPSNTRRMTARELAIVQSFPLDFEFSGNRSSAYRQIGNAVPPILGKAIGRIFKNNVNCD